MMDSHHDVKDFLLNVSSKYPSNVKLAHINAQSLNNAEHFSEFNYSFVDSGFNIIAVSETWFKNKSSTSIPGYKEFTVNRGERHGGGVAVYLSNELDGKVIAYSNGESLYPEFLMLEVSLKYDKILVACMYRPPKIGHCDIFFNELTSHIIKYKYTIVCGDFNIGLESKSTETRRMLNLLDECNIELLALQPTYHTPSCDTTLDIIASNCNELILDFGQTPAPGFSDHDLIYGVFNFHMPKQEPRMITCRDFSNFSKEEFCNDIISLPWKDIYNATDIEDKVFIFNSYFTSTVDKHAPMKTFKAKNKSAPWMTKEIRKLLKKRNKARKKCIVSKSDVDYECFRTLRNKAKQEVKKAKERYYSNLFNSTNSCNKMWSTVRSLCNDKTNTSEVSELVSGMSTDDLNEYYVSVGKDRGPVTTLNTANYYDNLPTPPGEKFHFKYVFANEVSSAILSIKSNATGPDCISVLFLKHCLDVITPVIEHLYNFCLQSSVFPVAWKMANVKPIPKTKQPTAFKDYRPVSILSVMGKAFEKIVYAQIIITINGFLNPLQSGFRKHHSTITALQKVSDDIRRGIDDRMITLLVLLDLSKAFDCVQHSILLSKLKSIGFSGSALQWVTNYLSSRFQRVHISKNCCSMWEQIAAGVPQGSVLGPLFFALYINDLPNILKNCKFHIYADDVQLYSHCSSDQVNNAVELVNEDIISVVNFLQNHNLYVNAGKTQPIIIGTRNYLNMLNNVKNIKVNNEAVQYKETVLNLGITFDQTLSWKEQAKYSSKKIFGSIAQIRRNATCMPANVRRNVVQALIFSVIDYGLSVCCNMSKETCGVLQKAQNAAVRFVGDIKKTDHITRYYAEYGWLKVPDRLELALVSNVWKTIKYEQPRYLYEMLQFNEKRDCITRSNNFQLLIPKHRTEYFGKSCLISAVKAWNKYEGYRYLHYKTPLKLKCDVKNALLNQYN